MKKTAWLLNSNRWNSAITEYSLSAARSLELAGWRVCYSGDFGKPAHQRASKLGLDNKPFQGFGLKAIPTFLKYYRAIKPDILLVFGGPETTLARLAVSCPVIRFRGQDRDLTEKASKLSYRLGQGHLSGVITPSLAVKDKFEGLTANLHQVALGCDTKKFSYHELLEKPERPIVTILGRLDPIKGHGPFFLWFSLLLQRWSAAIPRPMLRVIGEAANVSVEQITGFAEDVGLIHGENWELIPQRVPHIAKTLSQSHLGVICSQGSEVICRVAEEFLLCGCPIFVSGVGSLEECLLDPRFGGSYKNLPGNEAIKFMEKLIVDSFIESREEKKARSDLAKKFFSFDAMGSELDEYLSPLLSESDSLPALTAGS